MHKIVLLNKHYSFQAAHLHIQGIPAGFISSLGQGFGEANLEAQAMKLPVVSTDVIGPRESVENGTTGFLVPSKSAEAVCEALLKLVSDKSLREQMGTKGRERIIEKFDRKAIIAAVVRHRLSLLKERR